MSEPVSDSIAHPGSSSLTPSAKEGSPLQQPYTAGSGNVVVTDTGGTHSTSSSAEAQAYRPLPDHDTHSNVNVNTQNSGRDILRTGLFLESLSPLQRKRPRDCDPDTAESQTVAGPSRLPGQSSSPSKRIKLEEQDADFADNLSSLSSLSSLTSSDGVENGLLDISQSQESIGDEFSLGAYLSRNSRNSIAPLGPEDSFNISEPATPPPLTQQSTAEDLASESVIDPPVRPSAEPLGNYTCPICFSPPTYATLTPCGHVLCGECLFTAVKTTMHRAMYHGPEAERAKCPVCRVPIPGWDGRGGGVIGLQPRVVYKADSSKKPR